MPRDLAGLAALGALGYMMSKKGKNPDVDTSSVSDMDLTGGARSMPVDTGELRDETGALSKLRRNTETGDLYSLDEPITRPTSSSLSKVKNVVRNPAIIKTTAAKPAETESSVQETDFAPSGIGSGKKAAAPSMSFQDKMAAEYLAKKKAEKNGPVKTSSLSRPSSYYDSDNMKSGGKVVKMAKGGMTSSASSRGDGIASKGKTRGKIC